MLESAVCVIRSNKMFRVTKGNQIFLDILLNDYFNIHRQKSV